VQRTKVVFAATLGLVVAGIATTVRSSSAAVPRPAVPVAAQQAIKQRVPGDLRYVPTTVPTRYRFVKWAYGRAASWAFGPKQKVLRITFTHGRSPTFQLHFDVGGTSCSAFRRIHFRWKTIRFPGRAVPVVYYYKVYPDTFVWGCSTRKGKAVPISTDAFVFDRDASVLSLARFIGLARRLR
jgi:hypothetical protein